MRKTAFLILFLSCFRPMFAQQEGYGFLRLGTEDGLGMASNVVYSIYQDERGFMWVGSANGLQRFDGNRFINYGTSRAGTDELPMADLSQIIPGKEHELWLFFPTRNTVGLFNTQKLKFSNIPIQTTRSIPARTSMRLYKDSRGNIYIHMLKYGLLKYSPEKKAFTDDTEIKFPKGWFSGHFFYEDTIKRQFWFPCADSGIAVYDMASKQMFTRRNNPLNIPLLNETVFNKGLSEIHIDKQRRYWIFNWADKHIRRCFDYSGRQLTDTAGINSNPQYEETRYFFETKNGVLWLYGNNSLYSFNKRLNRFIYYKSTFGNTLSIQYESVYQIIEDKESNIWMATDNGLYMTGEHSGSADVSNYLFSEEKRGIEITDMIELTNGERWLSTWGSGVISMKKNLKSYTNKVYDQMPAMSEESKINYKQTWSLYQHTDGRVWIGCQAGKYMIYDTALKKTYFLEARELEKSTIRFITGDAKGNIWMSTQQGHVARYDGKKFTVTKKFGTIVRKILIDNEGLLWLATLDQGLYCLSADGTRILRHYTSGSPDNALFQTGGADIDQLNDSTLVFAAGAMNFINKKTGKVRWLTIEDGLPGNSVLRIRKDDKGNLWMITKNGLCRYNPNNNRVTVYGRKDGIMISNLTTEADLKCSDGSIMFGGANGFLFFHPSTFTNKVQPPDVAITDFKLLNTFIPVDSLLGLPEVRLHSHQNAFSIYFSALSYMQRDKLTYYYKMEGIDKDWIKADRITQVNYSHIQPGNYVFRAFCEDNDGNRSGNIISLNIYIRPPFWRTGWFISILLTIIVLVAYGMHRLRINKFIAVEKIRNRVSRDLHDDMGSTLSTINILSSMAKARLDDRLKIGEYLNKISDNSQRMMEAMDDIVWSIKPANDNMQKTVARMREFATNVLEAKNIELEFRVTEAVYDVKLGMEARKDFFLIFKEAVNNAAKYSKCTKASITIYVENKRLYLSVSDNGIGFNPDLADSGNGLGNIRKRADALHGNLQIISGQEEGTTVKLIIPVS
ncbi:MAG: hypothetical protein JNK08_11330 [Sediminibacterium sp.]|nr:hypothetical protein [Sediminibacterium sp.]